MKSINLDQFNELIKKATIKPRLKRELRFVTSTTNIAPEDWQELELVAIADRTGAKGVLLLAPSDDLFIFPYELSTRALTNRQTGRSQPIICDLCRTWQAGSNAAVISFRKDTQSMNSVSYLCCADLACSNHARSKTTASIASRAQLHEDLTNGQRVERLKNQLQKLTDNIGLEPVNLE